MEQRKHWKRSVVDTHPFGKWKQLVTVGIRRSHCGPTPNAGGRGVEGGDGGAICSRLKKWKTENGKRSVFRDAPFREMEECVNVVFLARIAARHRTWREGGWL